MSIKITGQDIDLAKLRKAARLVNGDAEPAYRLAGLQALQVFSNIYAEQGARFGMRWKQPSLWTKLLRVKPGKMFATLDEVKETEMNALEDTGLSRASFSETHPHGLFKITGGSAIVGSKIKYLKTHDQGGSSTFTFGPEQKARLKKNLRKTLQGPKPKTTPTGRKSRAKKNWNREFFITWNAMAKASGSSRKVHIRRLTPGDYITEPEMRNIHKAFEYKLNELMGDI